MNRNDKSSDAGTKPSIPGERINPSGTERDRTRNTPTPDMQAEDAGTADSGTEGSSMDAAESAMKQTSKTGSERGSADR